MRVLLILFLTLILVIIIGNMVFTLSQARERVLESQYVTSEKLVQVLQQQTADSINAVELALQSSARAFQLLPQDSQKRSAAVDEMLASSIRSLPFVRAIWVLDSRGDMIYDSEHLPGKYNLSDREYFKVHRENRVQGLFIDRPLLSKHGVWFIGLSMRITRPDGSFGGVVAAAFEPKHFRQFYESIRIGNEGLVSLLGVDGTLMLRVPEIAGAEGKKVQPVPKFVDMLSGSPAGSYRAESSIDQLGRIYFYRRIPNRPLVVVVGVGEHEALAPWRSTAQAYTAVSVAFLLLVAWLGYLALHELRRRAALHKALVDSEAALASAQHLSRIGSWELDPATGTGKWSDEMFALLGIEKAANAPPLNEFLALLHPDDRHTIKHAARNGIAWTGELRTNPENGPVRYLYARGTEVRNAEGRTVSITGTLQDVTERRMADDKLRLAARVFDHMQDGIIVFNADGIIVAVNDAFERMTGYLEEQVIGQHPRMLRSDRHDVAFYKAIAQSLQSTGEWRGELWGKRKNGETFPQWMTISAMRDHYGRVTGYVSVFTELSEIKEANAQLMFLANHDPLTRLPNRRLLKDRLEHAISSPRGMQAELAVLILNLDRLQRVNDSIGHDAGDIVLCETSKRLLARVPQGDTLARPGSDEFVIVLTQFDDSNDVINFAHRLREEVAAPIALGDHTVTVTTSVGIALYPQDGKSASELLKNADTALSHAKQRGPDALSFFTSTMNAQALHWISLEHALRGALERHELHLHYQPQVHLKDGKLSGVESLLRWENPALGRIMPGEFIPMAEDTGLIVSIGEWILHTACAQAKDWQRQGLPPLSVAVNVSGHQFSSGTLVGAVQRALRDTGLDPHCLEIELTESVLMRDTEAALRQLTALRDMGVRVSLDDFGTGYSSLAYLSRFTLDKLKIDQCFIRNITTDSRSAAIARATIALAHGLGITVVAEGVENDDQLDYLRAAGCDEIQGFIVGRPMPPEQLMHFQMDQKALASLLARYATGGNGPP